MCFELLHMFGLQTNHSHHWQLSSTLNTFKSTLLSGWIEMLANNRAAWFCKSWWEDRKKPVIDDQSQSPDFIISPCIKQAKHLIVKQKTQKREREAKARFYKSPNNQLFQTAFLVLEIWSRNLFSQLCLHILYCTIHIILYYAVLYHTLLYCTILYCVILYYTILHNTVLYYYVLHYNIIKYTSSILEYSIV